MVVANYFVKILIYYINTLKQIYKHVFSVLFTCKLNWFFGSPFNWSGNKVLVVNIYRIIYFYIYLYILISLGLILPISFSYNKM